jgi:hypothetical protein
MTAMPKSNARAAARYEAFAPGHEAVEAQRKTDIAADAKRWPIPRMLWVAALVSIVLWGAIGLAAWQAFQLFS